MKYVNVIFWMFLCLMDPDCVSSQSVTLPQKKQFNDGWKLFIGEVAGAQSASFDDSNWQPVALPHDGSIYGPFDINNPVRAAGGFLPTGMGYYRKVFTAENAWQGNRIYIDFDGIYRNSEIWINGHYLGKRPNGYISFRYELTPHLNYSGKNVLLVRVDNAAQPGSRWYTGSGIYRNVWLTVKRPIHIAHWGVQIATGKHQPGGATLHISTNIDATGKLLNGLQVKQEIRDATNRVVATTTSDAGGNPLVKQPIVIPRPRLWSPDDPYLYTVITELLRNGTVTDRETTRYGIRYFSFNPVTGFILNGKRSKIRGVCLHHDLGCLGAAINVSAMRRQLHLLKEMGCNGIRTAHNPPASELLDLCDEMGFIVMDEAFDVWKIAKTPFDYHWNWDAWHKRDLEDQVKRDRNHPSVFIWSIGNEIPEQLQGSEGGRIAIELRNIIRAIDTTRPITAANNHPATENRIIQSGALDLIGINYRHESWKNMPQRFPGKPLIGTETVSGLQTRGEYFLPSTVQYRWGDARNPVTRQPVDFTCSSFDQVMAPWGSTHEESLRLFEENDFLSGMYIWSGFDYIGEPTPYYWPARSSYFGIIDLAGFPKDVYYLYQSVWTSKPVLHLFPHWNWTPGQVVDVWAYYNNADEVELFLNNRSLGTRSKMNGALHVMWRVPFEPGTLTAVSRRNGKTILTRHIRTSGKPAVIQLQCDEKEVGVNNKSLAFIRVAVNDEHGNLVPYAGNEISFTITGPATLEGVASGNPISHESFKASKRKVFHGLCLAVIRGHAAGNIIVKAEAAGLQTASISLIAR